MIKPETMDYLKELSEEYDCPLDTVMALYDILGDNELYDGLVTTLEDYDAGDGLYWV